MKFLPALLCALCVLQQAFAALAGEQPDLKVNPDPAGGVRAVAIALFPGPPATVQAILSDYEKWPELFEVPMRMARIERHGDHTITDMYIAHSLLPGEQRLVTRSHSLPEGGLITNLEGGDFKRYRREWRLSPTSNGRETRADFELVVEVDTIVPDWLVALAMRRELEAHFRIVKEKVLTRAQQETQTR